MKILLGMSGGLDSTYAALKLLREGHSVEGAVLVMHEYTDTSSAEAAAHSLGIPCHVIDCKNEFQSSVVSNFISEYLAGRTPNPCIICNSEVKFSFLLKYAQENGFDGIATGHYAKIVKKGSRYAISMASDPKKDQSYMLWRLSQHVLSKLYFPLAEDTKQEVRAAAQNVGLYAADKEESQEICFVPDGDYAAYIESVKGQSPKGNFVTKDGKVLGEHNGIIRYTVGQRKGLGIAFGSRVFITDINPFDNTIVLSDVDEKRSEFLVSDIKFSGIEELRVGQKIRLNVKIRYLAPPVECTLEYLGHGLGSVVMDQPQRALTPGQSAVFYDGKDLVAGGFISSKKTQ